MYEQGEYISCDCQPLLCSMWGSNPRPLAHKTNTLPTELMEHLHHSPVYFLSDQSLWLTCARKPSASLPWTRADSPLNRTTQRVRGLVVMIVACQVMDPGSIPGERNFFFSFFLFWLPFAFVLLCCSTMVHFMYMYMREEGSANFCEKWVEIKKRKMITKCTEGVPSGQEF